MAALASLSASSFPRTSAWPGTQCIVIVAPWLTILLLASITRIWLAWPGLSDIRASRWIPAWLSEYILNWSPGLALELAYSLALVIPSSSPLYTICWLPIFQSLEYIGLVGVFSKTIKPAPMPVCSGIDEASV